MTTLDMKKVHGMTEPELYLLALIECVKQGRTGTGIMMSAFVWQDTQQGSDFWCAVYNEFPYILSYGLKKITDELHT